MSRWARFLCHGLGWHKIGGVLGYDGASAQAYCSRCLYVGLVDSQGNLF